MASLSQRLKKPTDPVRVWIDERFPNVKALVDSGNALLAGAPTVNRIKTGNPYSVIGTAIDYRIRYAFAITPFDKLAAFRGAAQYLTRLLSRLPEDHPARVFDVDHVSEARVAPWDLDPLSVDVPVNPVSEFAWRLEDRLPAIDPVGRCLPPARERELDRYCLTLAVFEQYWRSGGVLPPDSILVSPEFDLPERIPDEWVDDVAALAELFLDSWAELLARPANLNPTFALSRVVGGADADLIVDGTLVELKATIDPQVRPQWIRQLVGYLLLDPDDTLGIRALALYLVRQGCWIEWSVDEALDALAGRHHPSLSEFRGTFREAFETPYREARDRTPISLTDATGKVLWSSTGGELRELARERARVRVEPPRRPPPKPRPAVAADATPRRRSISYEMRCRICAGSGVCPCTRQCVARSLEADPEESRVRYGSLMRSQLFHDGRTCHVCSGRGKITVGRHVPVKAAKPDAPA